MPPLKSNRYASPALRRLLLSLTCVLWLCPAAAGQEVHSSDEGERDQGQGSRVGRFLGGAAIAFGAHEASHLTFDLLFEADPRLKRVDFHGIPFFAITHRDDLPPRKRLVIASAGFWAQHAGNEWILSRTPDLRRRRAPLRKGMVAFNVLASVAYAGAAFARTGPPERDTRGMAEGARLDERWIGAMILTPAALDVVRYMEPDATWALWASRAAKIGVLLLIVK